MENLPQLTKFFIRPEDIPLYEGYVDYMEFFGEPGRLNYCYDIRSAIVHGNEEKILEIYNKAMQKNKTFKELARDIEESYNNKKMKALSLANTMCFIVNRAIIKYWLENPSIVSYLKN